MQSYHDCVQRGGKKMPNPKDAKDYVERGLHYAKLGDHRQAIRDYNKAIELDPYYTTAYAGRGVAYFWLTDYRQAIRDFDRAIQLKPNFAMVYMARATAYLAMGDSSQVIDNYRIAAKLGDKKAQDFLRSLEESSTSPKPNKGISW
jgi:Tfp pilus assembly protein PilF